MRLLSVLVSIDYILLASSIKNVWTLYSGTSVIRSPTGLGKSNRNGEVTVLQGANLHGEVQFGTEQE